MKSIDKFRSLEDESVKTLCKVLCRPRCVTATVAPYLCVKVNARDESNLMLAVYFIKHQYRVSRYVTFGDVMLAGLRKIAGQHELEEDATEISVANLTVQTKDWLKTLEGIKDYLRTFRGINVTPLLYVVRKQLVPTSAAEYPSNIYDAIDEEIIARAPILVLVTVGTTVYLESNRPFIVSYLTDQATF